MLSKILQVVTITIMTIALTRVATNSEPEYVTPTNVTAAGAIGAIMESELVAREPEIMDNVTDNVASPEEPVVEEVIPEPEIALTDEEMRLIALVAMGEAGGEPERGIRLVIDVILNRVDHPKFPNTVKDVIYAPEQFAVMWNDRLDNCFVSDYIYQLVKEETMSRTNYDVVFFRTNNYHSFGTPLFQECCHYFSSY